jgi:hypothetical protein
MYFNRLANNEASFFRKKEGKKTKQNSVACSSLSLAH